MCGRFSATFTFREIKLRWNLQNDLSFEPRYKIAPSQSEPVIVRGQQGNKGKLMKAAERLDPLRERVAPIGEAMTESYRSFYINAGVEPIPETLLGRLVCPAGSTDFRRRITP